MKNAENQMSAKPVETTTRSSTYAPLASCMVAILSIAVWPLFNTFLSIGLAVSAFVLGIMGLVVARRSPTTSRYVCSAVGIILGAASLLFMENAAEPRGAAVCVATAAGAMMVVGTLWATATLHEPDEHQGRGGRKSPHPAFADVLRNR